MPVVSVANNSADLSTYYAAATSGEIIEIAPGTTISGFVFNGGTASNVTIEAQPGVVGATAVFQGVTIKNTSAGLTFSGLDFNNVGFGSGGGGVNSAANVTFVADDFSTEGLTVPPVLGAKTVYAFTVNASNDISFVGDNFHGFDNDTLYGVKTSLVGDTFSGLSLLYNNNIAVTGSTFSDLHDGIAYQSAATSTADSAGALGVNFSNNSFQYILDDAIRGAASNLLLANNNFYSQHPDPTDTDHPDSIQLWTAGDTLPSYNIEAIGNVATRGQSLFGGLHYGVVNGPPYTPDHIGFNTPANSAQGIFIKTIQPNPILYYSNVRIIADSITGANNNGAYNLGGSSGIVVEDTTPIAFFWIVRTGPESCRGSSRNCHISGRKHPVSSNSAADSKYIAHPRLTPAVSRATIGAARRLSRRTPHPSLRSPTMSIRHLIAAAALASVAIAGVARAATETLDLSGVVANSVYGIYSSGGVTYNTWMLPLGGLDVSSGVGIAQGDHIDGTINLDKEFSISVPTTTTALPLLFVELNGVFPSDLNLTSGGLTFLKNGAQVSTGGAIAGAPGKIELGALLGSAQTITFDSITLNYDVTQLSSPGTATSAALYAFVPNGTFGGGGGGGGGVPEPASWSLMLIGFGGLGSALRLRRSRTAALAG